MPDDLDYQWLGRLLGNPKDWTQKDYDSIAHLRSQAADSLSTTPANYFEVRRDLEQSIEDYDAAIARYRGDSS